MKVFVWCRKWTKRVWRRWKRERPLEMSRLLCSQVVTKEILRKGFTSRRNRCRKKHKRTVKTSTNIIYWILHNKRIPRQRFSSSKVHHKLIQCPFSESPFISSWRREREKLFTSWLYSKPKSLNCIFYVDLLVKWLCIQRTSVYTMIWTFGMLYRTTDRIPSMGFLQRIWLVTEKPVTTKGGRER